MMNFQRLTISMILIVLSIVHINASVRQAINPNCPSVNLCDFTQCTNGQCVDDKTTASCFRCECPVGFTGQSCETPIVAPSGCNPACLNGGECRQNVNNIFTCVCPADYTGDQCETSVLATHPCVTMPGTVCKNGGTCTINGSGYLCNCPTGFSGADCATQTTTPTTCSPDTCGAHGTCRVYITQNNDPVALCVCDSQWTGFFCETSLAGICSVDYCQAGGTCITGANGPYCSCPSTHTGERCEIPISPLSTTTTTTTGMTTISATLIPITTSTATGAPDSCSSNPCLNGGSCFNTGNSFICVCRLEFSGPTCSLQNQLTTPAQTTTAGPNPCLSSPCLNGGSCYRYGTSHICVCTSAYTGLTCDTVKTTTAAAITTPSSAITCANQPCQNGATCYSTGTSYFCYCGTNSNFAGKNCDTPKVASDPQCPLDCSPGHCVYSGSHKHPHACMCNGTLTPGSCRSQ